MDKRAKGPVVSVIDDDRSYRSWIEATLQAEGFTVESYECGRGFLEDCPPDRRGCALIDLAMPAIHGAELLLEMRSRGFQMPIIFLTATADVGTTATVMRGGALDLIEKPCEAALLVERVREAFAVDCKTAADRDVIEKQSRRLAQLTARERQVMELAVGGLANKQIARNLTISERTVEVHRARVMQKMEVESFADLVARHVSFVSTAA